MGHSNPFVTGERRWSQGYKAVGDGVVNAIPVNSPRAPVQPTLASASGVGSIIGNRKSQVYHLSVGGPGYGQVSTKNQITFDSESEAQAEGYGKAGQKAIPCKRTA
jgi:deoxyribonuclease-1